jgi:hypothetical protein
MPESDTSNISQVWVFFLYKNMIYKNEDIGLTTEAIDLCNDIKTLEEYESKLKRFIIDIEFVINTTSKDDRPENFGGYAFSQFSLMAQLKAKLKSLRKNLYKDIHLAKLEFWMLKCQELDPKNFDRYKKQAKAYAQTYLADQDGGAK